MRLERWLVPLLSLLALPAAARAEEVIVLKALVPSGFPAPLTRRLSRESRTRLGALGLTVRGGADIDVAAEAAADCPDAACLEERLGATGARLAARLRIDEAEGGFTAKLEVVTLRAGALLVNEEADCTGCSAQAVTEVALSLIDGVEIPAEDPAPPPPPAPEPPAPPPAPAAPPAPPRPEPTVSRHISPLVWVSGGVGVLLMGGAIPLLVMDGNETCDGPRSTCPEVYDTQTAGLTLMAVGAGLLVTAAVMAIAGWGPGSTESQSAALHWPTFDVATLLGAP